MLTNTHHSIPFALAKKPEYMKINIPNSDDICIYLEINCNPNRSMYIQPTKKVELKTHMFSEMQEEEYKIPTFHFDFFSTTKNPLTTSIKRGIIHF